MRAYGDAVDSTADDEQLRADLTNLMTDVEKIRSERHKLAHSVIALDVKEGWSPPPPAWLTWSPKTPDAEPQPLPDATYFANLVLHMNGLDSRTVRLRSRIVQRAAASESPIDDYQ